MPTAAACAIVCASCASCWKSRARSGGSLRRGAADQSRGAALAAQRSGTLGSPRSRRAARRGARSVGREAGLLADRLRPSRFAPRGATSRSSSSSRSSRRKRWSALAVSPPGTMVGQIKRGVLDLIGAARPRSRIRFFPGKSTRAASRTSASVSAATSASRAGTTRSRCAALRPDDRGGVAPRMAPGAHRRGGQQRVGSGGWRGSAGLECALSLGRRGYEVTLAEAADEIGGRLRFETRLPGLAGWGASSTGARVSCSGCRTSHLPRQSPDGGRHPGPGNTHVVIATGSRWARLLYSALEIPVGTLEGPDVFTPMTSRTARGSKDRSSSTTSTTTTWAARWRNTLPARPGGQLRNARGACIGLGHHEQ